MGAVEALVKYHSAARSPLTSGVKPPLEPWLVESLTGAVASQKVTEALKGSLRRDGNPLGRAKAQGSLTARQTGRAGTKVGLSDPTVTSGSAVAYRIKATPGITG